VLTDRSVQLLDVSAAGLLLADPRDELRVVAASSETARLLELFQLQNDEDPCLDCFRTGQPVQAGFAAVQALPMRLREQVIGALNLQTALNSRVVIEQAKGKLAERLGVDMDQAFALLRDHARASNRRLSDLARAFIDGTESVTGPDPGRTRPPRPASRPSP
jgi:hypothetical protein